MHTIEYQSILKEYKSACMDTDEMIGKLFKHLNDTGLIQNTTVVLYSDHNAYYQNLSKNIKGTQDHDLSSQMAYKVPMMLYSKKISRSRVVDSFCSTYDIYPTIGAMYGLPYNKINAQGKDILSAEISDTIYNSALTGFYNSKCHSKNMLYITKYDGTTNSDVETFKTNVCEFLSKQRTLIIVYKSNKTYK
jgi:arylsulfatase A-like enzyme